MSSAAAHGALQVRPLAPGDELRLQQLTHAAFADLHLDPPTRGLEDTPEMLAAEIARDGGLIAEFDGKAVGAVRFRSDPETPGVRWLRRLGVHPNARGRGVAGALVSAASEPGLIALRAGVRHQLPENADRFRHWGFALLARHAFWDAYELSLPRTVETAAAMRALGVALAGLLGPGDLVLLTGPLGAGKTALAQGIGVGLGVAERLTSPTFVLAREHVGRLALVHVDAYRLGGLAELDDLDLDTPAESAVTLVEWGGGLAETLADGHLLVEISRSEDPDDDVRTVRLTGVGTAWDGRRERLAALDW